jgi:amidase
VDRRDFLKLTALGSVIGGTTAAGRTLARKATPPPVNALAGASATELTRWMVDGQYSARSIVDGYLSRIAALDADGPALNAVLETNRNASVLASARDSQREGGLPVGPLHGIPVMVKDNLDSAGGSIGDMLTTAGSLALMESRPRISSTVVERLVAAGAVLSGKTNLSEWANFRSSRSSSGWSSRGGQTRNPHVLDRNPCGSSSGSGTAVAAGLCTAAIGTETNGSIVCPAGTCGIVGLKPTVGLVSRAGIVPISASQDTAGPMTGNVTDAAIVLGAIAGPDPRDPATAASAEHVHADYTRFLDRDGLRGARIGVMRRWMGRHDGVDAVFEAALEKLRAGGAVLVDPVEVDTWGDFGDASYEVLKFEFKAGLNAYLEGRVGPGPRTLAEVIAFNESHRSTVLKWFGQDIMVDSEALGSLDDPAYVGARAKCVELARVRGLDLTLARDGLDAIVAPTNGPAWTTDLVNGDNWVGISSSSAPAVAGYPNITVPAGDVLGLPIGISFFAGAWAEPTLLRIAYAFEQVNGPRRLPEYVPTLG